MTYDEYVLKVRSDISKLQSVLKWIKKHRLKIASAVLAVIAAVLLLMYFSGSFTSGLKVDNVVYGEPVNASAKAFLSGVGISHTENDGETPGLPYRAGGYTVTARTENPFGTVREQSAPLVIARRPVTLSLEPFSVTYGDRPDVSAIMTAEGLAEGDTAEAEIVYDELKITGQAEIGSVVIRNENGEDVTDCYDIKKNGAAYRVNLRNITVATGSAEKRYDGTPLTDHGFSVTSGSLAAGDELVVVTETSVLMPGKKLNEAVIAVMHGGEDRTKYYSVTQSFGTLSVLPIPINVKTGSAVKVYDGQPLTCGEYELDDSDLLPGHKANAGELPSRKAAGTTENRIPFTVTDAEGNDVTACYELICDCGTLTVEKRKLTFASGSDSGVYGKEIKCTDAWPVSGEPAPGETYLFTDFESFRFAGEHANHFRAAMRAGDNDTSSNYAITYENGTVTIMPKRMTVKVRVWGVPGASTSFIATVEPDTTTEYGDSLEYPWQIPLSVSNELIGPYFESKFRILNEKVTVTYCYDLTFVYEYDEDELDRVRKEAPPVVPGDGPGTDPGVGPGTGPGTDPGIDPGVGPGTDPGTDPGTTPGADDIYGPSGIGSQGISGGTSESTDIPSGPPSVGSDPVGYVSCAREGGLYLRLRSYGNYTGSGWTESPIYDMASEIFPHPLDMTFVLLNNNGFQDGADNVVVAYYPNDGLYPVPYYSFSENYKGRYIYTDVALPDPGYQSVYAFYHIPQPDIGTILGLRRDNYDEDYYNFVWENYLSLPKTTADGIKEIIERAGLDPLSPTIIEDVAEYVRGAALYNGNFKPFPENVDKILYFLNESKEGICSHFASAAVAIYRTLGIPARYTGGYYAVSDGGGSISYYYEANAHAWAEVYVKGIGWLPVEVTSSNVAPGGTGSPLQPPSAELIYYNRVNFTMEPKTKVFDGEKLVSNGPVLLPGSNLRPGHTLTAESNEITYAGTVPARSVSFRITDEAGNDVTYMYEVNESVTGYLTVTPLVYDLPQKTLYVGQTVKLPETDEITDGRVAAFIDADRIEFVIEGSASLAVSEDGKLTGIIATDMRTLEKSYDVGSDDTDDKAHMDGGSDVIVHLGVTVLPFENVRIKDGAAPAGTSAGTLKRVTGENGQIYNYIAVSSASVSKAFDGAYLTSDSYTITDGALDGGHTLVFKSGASQLYVGSCRNVYSELCVTDESGANVTDRYIIDFYPGTLEVTAGSYTTDDKVAEVRVDEVKDLDTVVWMERITDLPVRYVDERGSAIVRIEDGRMIGIDPGFSVVTALIDATDLNGDGVAEYEPAVRSLGVRVLPKERSDGSVMYLLFLLTLAAAAAAVTYLIITASKYKEKQ